jgi:hypothetical protein
MVMLSAAIRDLHRCYPGQFVTDVRTLCPEIWENNPYITPLSDDGGADFIECSYPLINECNHLPYHCLHGYIDFLNRRLSLNIQLSSFRGDIHLSDQEKAWYSQVHELASEDIPFWIIVAGGKYDVTIKWWETERYQEVVDHFRGRIQFVQVGEWGHHHPRLERVIDLRGETNIRELIRLVYHAQGVLCPVTAAMHMAAAVEVKQGQMLERPCVVIAGGREPTHWEAYPNHQFIHRIGALPCSVKGGCWKDRVVPLGDGDERDQPDRLCSNVREGLPACMALISPEEVIRRIQLYFDGGMATWLTPKQARAAHKGVRASVRSSTFDEQPLNLHNARLACEAFIKSLPAAGPSFSGRGIVICGGGLTYFTNAWVNISMLRKLGCSLPVQVWHLGEEELDTEMATLLKTLGAEAVDAFEVRKKHPIRQLKGWELKPYAILHSPFREVLFLDADNVAVVNPEFLFEREPYRQTGAIFWPDYGQFKKTQVIWESCGIPRPDGPEFESGQIVIDKARCWQALRLTLWFNEHSDFYYQHLHGDKETFHLGFKRLGKSFAMPRTPIHPLKGTMCQHDFEGKRLFQHRNLRKWSLFQNLRIEDFWLEEDCLAALDRLRRIWDGRMSRYRGAVLRARTRTKISGPPSLCACMISCPERTAVRERTVQSLAATDWGARPLCVQIDPREFADKEERQIHTSKLALERYLESEAEYMLFLEDDLEFNRHFSHNITHWPPFRERLIALASLYTPGGIHALACDAKANAMIVDPSSIYGSQAYLLSRRTAEFILEHWSEQEGKQDIKFSRLAARMRRPIFYHAPSLVQHVGVHSAWGGSFHQSADYAAEWKASSD